MHNVNPNNFYGAKLIVVSASIEDSLIVKPTNRNSICHGAARFIFTHAGSVSEQLTDHRENEVLNMRTYIT